MSAKVSVIIPIYNVEKYLKQCVDSVLNQSFKDIEILLINDESPDNSIAICKEYEKKDYRIKVFSKKNEGLGLTRNYGINHAIGKYVVFVDSDDYIDPEYIEKMYNCMEENNLDVCYTTFCKFLSNSNKIMHYGLSLHGNKNSIKYNKVLSNNSNYIKMSAWSSMYRMDIIKEHNIQFHSEREYISEDLIFNIDYTQYVKRYMILNNVSYFYRVNNDSLTHIYKADRFDKNKELYSFCKRELKNVEKYRELKNVLANIFLNSVRHCMKEEYKYNPKYKVNIKRIINDVDVQEAIREKTNSNIKKDLFDMLIKRKKYNIIVFILKLKDKI